MDPAEVAPHLPPGTHPDTFEGKTYAGLVAFRMHRIGWLTLPGLPYLGTFPETNIRLYSTDDQGRRAVVFRTLEASRLLPVLVARLFFRLPYTWSRMRVTREDQTLTYTSHRRWPSPRTARTDLAIRIGAPIPNPTPLDHFLTARWGLHRPAPNPHTSANPTYLPNAHPRWPLHQATLLHCTESLFTATGLPTPTGPPVSVLYSPGVPVHFGPPLKPKRASSR
jgi:uncharacterized protein YqjF (DUF2071 family)